MSRAFNFCAGPAALPEAVLKQAQQDLVDWHGRGCSVMEMSHRGADFVSIAEQAEQDLRDLLAIPSNYKVLFLQGGASQQFAQVPMNLLAGKASADYVCTGVWSEKAIAEAKKFGGVNVVATDVANNFRAVPAFADWQLDKNAAYLHYTPNETIHGVEYDFIPQVDVPLVADYSSSILSEPLDVSKFGLIYAGAQKNIGPAGIVVVIVREDLLGHMMPGMPTMLDYAVAAKNGSMYNTPPTYSWYLSGLVFQWLKAQGGLEAMATLNARKAAKLYSAIDTSDFYANPVAIANRSRMNVPFTLADASLDKTFLKEAEALQLLNLAGHRSVGGMRASLYNAVPEAAVDALIDFMGDFERRYG
ncbi:MAG: 3-phosphoserine/phosphohydroxythreonine transaminase [Paraperlucidibaca sp.]|jgi:phosphoserine aminotransferase|uniref:3-phosphoserine/phosphohydroxythreonine transaminase n=1 Tax=Paraperlucidibaca sp. TaxID=2708021 RepID=UPI001B75849F|nr:3-phosphoserine/phosphohydroxythreonine transaminase [Paraperlucidibaca sp.]MBQ0722068.1 3-phosphoserine/phosphohydroxythreonine transaminase [Paraperlucidibaca sp.]MBQ0842149.1 3-phosphoserine/phosphohydroxythreonine transaminase [Paraperlucidibaca sp.]|tara:strand:- start:3986 stop:5065 length:1080 start_codon:yes stop_codon:yes gene_type:complete